MDAEKHDLPQRGRLPGDEGSTAKGMGTGTFVVAESPLDYDERTYSECCVMGCTPKMNGGGEADFAEQSAERRNKRRLLAVSEAKRGKLTIAAVEQRTR